MLGRFRKDEIRKPNLEIRNNIKCPKSKCLKRAGELRDLAAISMQFHERVSSIQILRFGLVSTFVFRASDLKARGARGSDKVI
jgi:hypothetical protein